MEETILGINFKKLREKHGMSQKELAARLGVKPSAVSNIENGWTKSLKQEQERKMLSLFKITRDELYYEEPERVRRSSLFPLLTGRNYGKRNGFIYEVNNEESDFVSVPFCGNVNFCAVATGDSMYNPRDEKSIRGGDYVACLFADKQNVRYGEIYLIDTKEGVFIRKLLEGVHDSFFCLYPPQ